MPSSSTPAARSAIRKACSRPEIGLLDGAGQRELEGGPRIRLRLRPDAAAVAHDDAVRDGQAHARALELARTVQPLEHAEQLVGVLHVEARAVVRDRKDHFPAFDAAADADARLRPLRAVLEGIADQVRPYVADDGWIRCGRWQCGDLDA